MDQDDQRRLAGMMDMEEVPEPVVKACDLADKYYRQRYGGPLPTNQLPLIAGVVMASPITPVASVSEPEATTETTGVAKEATMKLAPAPTPASSGKRKKLTIDAWREVPVGSTVTQWCGKAGFKEGEFVSVKDDETLLAKFDGKVKECKVKRLRVLEQAVGV